MWSRQKHFYFLWVCKDVMKENKAPRVEVIQEWRNQAKWTPLVENNDLRTIWKAIGWNGSMNETVSVASTDGEFKRHFEDLLNPDQLEHSELS